MFRGGLWLAEQEVGVTVHVSVAVLECVVERGAELEPFLDSGVLVPHFAYAFLCLVAGEYAVLGSPKVTAKAFESPNDAAGLLSLIHI